MVYSAPYRTYSQLQSFDGGAAIAWDDIHCDGYLSIAMMDLGWFQGFHGTPLQAGSTTRKVIDGRLKLLLYKGGSLVKYINISLGATCIN